MVKGVRTFAVSMLVAFFMLSFTAISAYSAELKAGYVDLRRAFYEYEKAKTMEDELTKMAESKQAERTKMVEKITKLRDEAELLSGDAKSKKQGEVDAALIELQEFDKTVRTEVLTKRNDMFRQVVDDIQKVVEELGKKENYDYVFDSRDIMYAKEGFDLTEKVLKQLNKK